MYKQMLLLLFIQTNEAVYVYEATRIGTTVRLLNCNQT